MLIEPFAKIEDAGRREEPDDGEDLDDWEEPDDQEEMPWEECEQREGNRMGVAEVF